MNQSTTQGAAQVACVALAQQLICNAGEALHMLEERWMGTETRTSADIAETASLIGQALSTVEKLRQRLLRKG